MDQEGADQRMRGSSEDGEAGMTELTIATAVEVTFEVRADPGSRVFVVGTFNNWNPRANPLVDNPDSGHYKTVLRLPRGIYEYKFIINGVWSADPNCPTWIPNAYGSLNSLLKV